MQKLTRPYSARKAAGLAVVGTGGPCSVFRVPCSVTVTVAVAVTGLSMISLGRDLVCEWAVRPVQKADPAPTRGILARLLGVLGQQ